MSPAVTELRIYTDGASRANPGPASCAYVALGADNTVLATASDYLGPELTNNVAEYRGMILALTQLPALLNRLDSSPCFITIRSDSRLIVEQINGSWKVRDQDLKPLHAECQQRLARLRTDGHRVSLQWIPREQNSQADRLCNQALDDRLPDGNRTQPTQATTAS